ncbi:MAG: VWA domain-containing protein, partial [Methanomicrobiaceae archaeon]|nr:VWA domain-containing protein [Methanomicrobiaceae archaeon]
QPDPIDVILCTDRSGSMLYDNPDRMHSAREAAKILVGQLSENRDQVGTISFGRSGYISRPGVNSGISTSEIDNDYIYPLSYSDYATIDSTLISNFVQVNQSLDEMVPDHGTPMRYGIYRSINELKENGRSSAVKAIVLLGDGDWNWYGDPLARGTGYPNANYPNVLPTQFGDLTQNYMIFSGLSDAEQNMAVYAENNGIRIYSIAYANSISYQGRSVLQKLAEETGGKYYYAPFGDDLAGIYAEIAGDLKTEAGVGTEVHLSFETVSVNDVPISGKNVLEYMYLNEVSTRIDSYPRVSGTDLNITPPSPHTSYPYTQDDTASWQSTSSLDYNVGTVKLGQIWEATFRLKVKKDGNINIFGSDSKITFNDGEDELALPDTFITAIPDLNSTGLEGAGPVLHVSNLNVAPSAANHYLPLSWDLTYNGSLLAKQELQYKNATAGEWNLFDTQYADSTATGGTSRLDVRYLPEGKYLVRVKATADDVDPAPSIDEKEFIVRRPPQILLE